MDKNIEFLKYIYMSAMKARDACENVAYVCETEDMLTLLDTRVYDYDALMSECIEKLDSYNLDLLKEKTIIKKIKDEKNIKSNIFSYDFLEVNEIEKVDDSFLAKQLIKGASAGKIDVSKKLSNGQNIYTKGIKKIATKLLTIEDKNIKQFKEYV
ncbi:MAG: hypothetical protein RR922_05280 [Clostridia bacterium]